LPPNFPLVRIKVELTKTDILDLLADFMLLTVAYKSIYGKSKRTICAPTYDEYFGQKIYTVGS